MTWGDMCEKAIDYFSTNEDELLEVLDDAGIKEYGMWYPMTQLEDKFSGEDAITIFQLAIDSVNEHYFDLDEDYFCINGDGLLSSTDDLDVMDILDYDCIERIYREREYTRLPKYIERLFESYESDDFDDEEDDDEE